MIVLLDLNYTFAVRAHGERQPFADFRRCIAVETYRQWLLELIRPHYVILITARPQRFKDSTLARIREQTHWQPAESHFNSAGLRPPQWKLRALHESVFPAHGQPHDGKYLAIESNPATRAMYSALNIPSIPVGETPWRTFEEIVRSATV